MAGSGRALGRENMFAHLDTDVQRDVSVLGFDRDGLRSVYCDSLVGIDIIGCARRDTESVFIVRHSMYYRR